MLKYISPLSTAVQMARCRVNFFLSTPECARHERAKVGAPKSAGLIRTYILECDSQNTGQNFTLLLSFSFLLQVSLGQSNPFHAPNIQSFTIRHYNITASNYSYRTDTSQMQLDPRSQRETFEVTPTSDIRRTSFSTDRRAAEK